MIFREQHESMVPALGLGTWQMTGDDCMRAVEHALALGYRHLDTAQGYDNERQVGEGLRRSGVPRSKVFITTKVRPRFFAPEDLGPSVEESLEKLAVEHVDLLLLHWPRTDVPLEDTLGALHEVRLRGLTRHVGVSNFAPSWVERAAASGPIFTNQVEYHPYLSQDALLEQAESLDLTLTAYAPLARGRLDDDATLQAIGAEHGKTPAQVALRWLLQQPRVLAIPKASSPEHQIENLSVFDFELSDDEMAQVDALDRGLRLVDDFDVDWER